MFRSKNSQTYAVIAAGLLAVAFAAGCNKPKHRRSTTPAASNSAGVTAAAAGPCDKYAASLCEKAGKESELCQAITTSVDVMSPAACSAGLDDIQYSVKKLGTQGKACE